MSRLAKWIVVPVISGIRYDGGSANTHVRAGIFECSHGSFASGGSFS
jgi:hypothetical protein